MCPEGGSQRRSAKTLSVSKSVVALNQRAGAGSGCLHKPKAAGAVVYWSIADVALWSWWT